MGNLKREQAPATVILTFCLQCPAIQEITVTEILNFSTIALNLSLAESNFVRLDDDDDDDDDDNDIFRIGSGPYELSRKESEPFLGRLVDDLAPSFRNGFNMVC